MLNIVRRLCKACVYTPRDLQKSRFVPVSLLKVAARHRAQAHFIQVPHWATAMLKVTKVLEGVSWHERLHVSETALAIVAVSGRCSLVILCVGGTSAPARRRARRPRTCGQTYFCIRKAGLKSYCHECLTETASPIVLRVGGTSAPARKRAARACHPRACFRAMSKCAANKMVRNYCRVRESSPGLVSHNHEF